MRKASGSTTFLLILLVLLFPEAHMAEAASKSCGQTVTGTIAASGQKDLHTFSGTAGEAVLVTAAATSGSLSAFAELLNPAGTVIAGNAGNGSTGSIVLSSTGTYTIRVSDFLPGNRTGGYELNLQFTKGGGCASAIACDQIASGNLSGISGFARPAAA